MNASSPHDSRMGTVAGHAATLGLLAACCVFRWLLDPLLEDRLTTLPMAVATLLSASWFGAGPAAVAVIGGALASELLFARPRADVVTMLVRNSGPLAFTAMAGSLVAWIVSQLRTRTIQLDREVAMRRQAESDLAASRRRFEQFLDAAPFCAYLKDADGRFLFHQPASP